MRKTEINIDRRAFVALILLGIAFYSNAHAQLGNYSFVGGSREGSADTYNLYARYIDDLRNSEEGAWPNAIDSLLNNHSDVLSLSYREVINRFPRPTLYHSTSCHALP